MQGQTALEEQFRSCQYVIHTASPFKETAADPQKELVDPAVKGTQIVLDACNDAGVKRVVVTSSTAAITPQLPSKAHSGKLFTEGDWQRDATIKDGPYRLAKRLAEEMVWSFVKEDTGVEVAVINPSFVIGPPVMTHVAGESLNFMKTLLEGGYAAGAPGRASGAVDVRDVADAHIAAMTNLAAPGSRFLLSSASSFTKLDLANQLRQDSGKRFVSTHAICRGLRL